MTNTTLIAILVIGTVFAASVSINDAYAAAFVKYDGIDGESQDANHNKWIDVLSVDWGVSRSSSDRKAIPSIEDLTLVMEFDKASPKLLEAVLTGKAIPKLEIELTATYGGARATYLKYELTNVLVTSFQTNASGNDEAGPPTVVVGNNFEEIKVTYTEYDDAGSSKGNVETQYKVGKGKR